MQTIRNSAAVAAEKLATISNGVRVGVHTAQSEMRTKPAIWAGIAAAAGLTVGLVSRYLQDHDGH
jgi:hypothetical protein